MNGCFLFGVIYPNNKKKVDKQMKIGNLYSSHQYLHNVNYSNSKSILLFLRIGRFVLLY